MTRLRGLPAALIIGALLLSPRADAGDVRKTQMGGAIQGVPLTLSGLTSTLAGDPLIGSQDGMSTAARFNLPSGVTTDGSSLYVTDTGNKTIRVID